MSKIEENFRKRDGVKVNVSVIVPVYNVEKYLRACLDSVLQQDLESFEVIAVNDGSTDSCADILLEYSKKYDNLKVITQENQGLGGARNTGIQVAEGEYLLFLDSDDTLSTNVALSFLYEKAMTTDADMVCFGMNYTSADGDILSVYKVRETGEVVMSAEQYLLTFANNSYACNKMYRTSLFKKNNIVFPQRAWYEDLATIPKIILQSTKVLLTDQVFYNYLQRSNSIMHSYNLDRNIEMIDAVDGVLSYYRKHRAFDKYYAVLEYLTVLHVLVLATNRVASANPKHPLLKQFREYCIDKFPVYAKNDIIRQQLPFKRKLIYALSKCRFYMGLFWLNKLYGLRK